MAWEAGRNFLMGQGIYYVMGAVALLGLICITLLYIVGRSLYKRALNPDREKTGYISGICREFERQLAAGGNVDNVDNFVDNYLSVNKFGIISLISWDWFCGQLVYLCLLIGITCGGLGYIWKMDSTQCLNILLFGAGLFGILLCIKRMTNYGARMEKVRLNLTAYFENKVIPEYLKKNKEKGNTDKEEAGKRADKRAKRSERLIEEAQNEKRKLDGTQAEFLVKMNATREFAQKTMENEKDKIHEVPHDLGQAEMEIGIRETAATLIHSLDRESTKKTSQTLTEKEEKIIADILKDYAK